MKAFGIFITIIGIIVFIATITSKPDKKLTLVKGLSTGVILAGVGIYLIIYY